MGDAARSIGGYEVLGTMGAGTVGTVYRARQVAMDRFVALKILNAKYASDPSFVKGFIAEARTAGRINHANVCQVYDVGSEGGVYFFSMELVDGPTLEQVLKERGRMPADEAVRIVRGVASALSAAHDHGLVHRDVKPANIVLADSGEPKLVDLGVAKDVTAPGADLGSGLVGTPYYMAPEQGQGKPVDIRSDIYGLGATFYHLLVGRPPFMGPHPTAVIVKHASEPLTPPSELDPDIPRKVSAVVERMMAKKPEDRYPTPSALVADLDQTKDAELTLEPEAAPARAAAPVFGPRKAPRRRPAARAGRRRNVAIPVAVGGGAVLALLIIAMVLSGGRDPAVVKAERDLARASSLLGKDEPGAADEAAKIAASVRKSLPPRSELRGRAARLMERAEEKKVALAIRRIDRIVLAVAEATSSAEDAKAVVDGVARQWRTSLMSRDARDRVNERCREAMEKIDAVAGRSDEPSGPKLSELTRTTLALVEKALKTDLYADAMTAIADVMPEMHGDDRAALQEAKSKVRERAAKDFSALMDDLQEKIDAGDLAQAQADLETERPRFAFGAYPSEIKARFSELRKIAAEKEAQKRVEEDRATAEARAAEEARLAAERRAEAEAEAAADAAAQKAAAAFFDEKGWDPQGGTWKLERGVLKLVVPEGSTAKLVFGDGKRVPDVTTQFDLRILRGKGVRLQYRWTESAGGDPGFGGGFGGRGLDLSKGYALLMGAQEVELQVRGAPARGLRGWRNVMGYQTWTKKGVRGTSWNRYAFQARGTRIAASVNTRVQLTRVDDAFQSGMVRFEFLEGCEIEMRKLVIRMQ
ncbi:MAG: serine/threonine-protein kinase [Planctomycetota bacterium]|jgi:serine/threonine-protein kinase